MPTLNFVKDNAVIRVGTGKYAINSGITAASSTIYSRLTIRNTNPSDTGVYYCVISDGGVTANSSATLTVLATPTVSSAMSSYSVNESGSVTFHCTGTGFPEPVISWYKNGALINNSRFIESQNGSVGSLTLINASRTDTSINYQCIATNSLGNATATFSLGVNRKCYVITILYYYYILLIVEPFGTQVISAPTHQTISEYGSASFTCTMSGYERPTITWIRYGTTLTNGAEISITTNASIDQITSVLTLSNINRNLAGVYQCFGSNPLNTVTVETRLTVKCKLVFKSTWLYFT